MTITADDPGNDPGKSPKGESPKGEELADRKSFFDKMIERASHFGFKAGFPSVRYKEQYGDWPPDEWSKTARRIYMSDPKWQARLDHRNREREHYEAWERDVRPIAEARKVEWLMKNAGPERVGPLPGEKGTIASCYQSEKRARPIHGFVIGEDVSLCGRLVERWITQRRPFTTTTEYGCKKCKAVFAKRNQLPLVHV